MASVEPLLSMHLGTRGVHTSENAHNSEIIHFQASYAHKSQNYCCPFTLYNFSRFSYPDNRGARILESGQERLFCMYYHLLTFHLTTSVSFLYKQSALIVTKAAQTLTVVVDGVNKITLAALSSPRKVISLLFCDVFFLA